ncbi:MAG: orotidine-5'-phosphate decarboxylase [Actinomycetota bacterium]
MSTLIDPPICIALDVSSLDEAKRLLDALAGRVSVFKVGLELFTAAGPQAVREVTSRNCDVFLDLKIHDIPNTAARAVRAAERLGARFLTIHGSGGREMVRAAIEGTTEGRPELLVVSVVTSLDEDALREVGVTRSIAEQVDAMAALASEEQAPGLVLAASEVARVRAAHPGLFLLVPGIRPAGSDAGDQKRVGTPGDVVVAGADLIVLGRSVTQAAHPAAATDRILDEIQSARDGVSTSA